MLKYGPRALLLAGALAVLPASSRAQIAPGKQQEVGVSATLKHHFKWKLGFQRLAFSADGKFFAAGALDGKAFVWEVESGKEKILLDCGGMIGAIALSAEGERLAVGAEVKSAKTREFQGWDISGRNLFKFDKVGIASAIVYQPDGKRLISHVGLGLQLRSAVDGTVQKSVETGQFLAEMDVSRDAKVIATAGSADKGPKGSIRLWSADSLEPIRTLNGHDAIVRGLSFSPSGERIATAGNDGVLRIWDAKSGKLVLTIADAGYGVAYSPDGNHIATTKGKVLIRDAETGKEVLCLQASPATMLAFNRDGTMLATAGAGAVQIWEFRANKQAQKDK